MTDEQEQSTFQPPDLMTECCNRFFEEGNQLQWFIAFISQLAVKWDDSNKVAMETLHWLYTQRGDEEKAEYYERSLGSTKDLAVVTLSYYRQLFLQMMLSRAVDNYLVYIADLLALIFRTKPETLRSSEKVRLDVVLSHSTMEDLVNDLAERRVNQLSYQGMRDLSAYLSDTLGFDLFRQHGDLQRAVLVTEVRNLIVHNRAVVNAHFLSRIPDYPVRIGELIELTTRSVFYDLYFLGRSVADIDTRASAKFGLPQPISNGAEGS